MQCKIKPICSLNVTFTGYLQGICELELLSKWAPRNFSLPALCNLFATHLPSLTLLFVAVHLLAVLVTPCFVHQSHTQTPHPRTHTLSHIKSIIKTFLTSHFHSWQLFFAHVFVLFFLFSPPTLTQLAVVLLTDGKRYSNFSRRSPLRC